jgi:putative addiction module killer protein
MVDNSVYVIYTTKEFRSWYSKIRDIKAALRIQARLRRLELGNAGDAKPVGSGVSELRIDCGPGYRIYFVQRGGRIAILLCGGDKVSQRSDIKKAMALKDDEDLMAWRSN